MGNFHSKINQKETASLKLYVKIWPMNNCSSVYLLGVQNNNSTKYHFCYLTVPVIMKFKWNIVKTKVDLFAQIIVPSGFLEICGCIKQLFVPMTALIAKLVVTIKITSNQVGLIQIGTIPL